MAGEKISRFIREHWLALLVGSLLAGLGALGSAWAAFTHKTIPEKVAEWLSAVGLAMPAFRTFLGVGMSLVALLSGLLVILLVRLRPIWPDLVVRSAKYGVGGTTDQDVTAVVRSHVRNGQLRIQASNAVFGHVFPGQKKVLRVWYSRSGSAEKIEAHAIEDEWIDTDGRAPTRVEPAAERPQISPTPVLSLEEKATASRKIQEFQAFYSKFINSAIGPAYRDLRALVESIRLTLIEPDRSPEQRMIGRLGGLTLQDAESRWEQAFVDPDNRDHESYRIVKALYGYQRLTLYLLDALSFLDVPSLGQWPTTDATFRDGLRTLIHAADFAEVNRIVRASDLKEFLNPLLIPQPAKPKAPSRSEWLKMEKRFRKLDDEIAVMWTQQDDDQSVTFLVMANGKGDTTRLAAQFSNEAKLAWDLARRANAAGGRCVGATFSDTRDCWINLVGWNAPGSDGGRGEGSVGGRTHKSGMFEQMRTASADTCVRFAAEATE
jgi:hypothetical protein